MSDRRRRVRWARRFAVFAPAAIVVVAGALSFGALRRSLETRDVVSHTRLVLQTSSELLTALLDAETGERGYLLTRDTTFLQPFYGASPRIDSLLVQLRTLVRDDARQRARIDTLAQRANERLSALRSAILDARSGQNNVAIGVVAHGPGKQLMDSVRRLIAAIDAQEEDLLRERQSEESRSRQLLYALLILGTLIASLMALLVNRNFDRALDDRRQALRESQSANERLQDQAIELEHQAEAAQLAAADAESATESAQRALHAAEESERRAERLQAATEALTGALSRSEVANLIVEQATAALGAHSGVLAALESDRIHLVAVRNVSAVNVGDMVSVNENLPLCIAVRTGQPVVVTHPEKLRDQFPNIWPAHAADGVKAVAAFPMENYGRILGGLLIRFSHARPLGDADRAFMGAMSRIAAEAFERARLFDAEREARTAAEAANRAKAAFLASMSHELRTPLQAALGFAQLIRSGLYGPVTAEQSEVLGRVERSQMHLARLIDDILDFARLEAGRVRIKLGAVPVSEVFAELGPILEPQVATKQIALALESPEDGMAVTADRHRLQQILINLVSNAVKFTPEGGTVRVEASREDGRGVIRVCDNGVGIPADRLDSIFEPFVQVDAELTRTASGAGLGLAISRDFARMMGGDLTVASTVGKGSTFTVWLPVAAESDDAAPRQR